MANAALAPHYGFPTEGLPRHNLNDVISPSYPFAGALLGLDGENATAPVTHAAAPERTQPGMIARATASS